MTSVILNHLFKARIIGWTFMDTVLMLHEAENCSKQMNWDSFIFYNCIEICKIDFVCVRACVCMWWVCVKECVSVRDFESMAWNKTSVFLPALLSGPKKVFIASSKWIAVFVM